MSDEPPRNDAPASFEARASGAMESVPPFVAVVPEDDAALPRLMEGEAASAAVDVPAEDAHTGRAATKRRRHKKSALSDGGSHAAMDADVLSAPPSFRMTPIPAADPAVGGKDEGQQEYALPTRIGVGAAASPTAPTPRGPIMPEAPIRTPTTTRHRERPSATSGAHSAARSQARSVSSRGWSEAEPSTIYERCELDQRLRNEKLLCVQRQRQEQLALELAEATFTPKIKRYSTVSATAASAAATASPVPPDSARSVWARLEDSIHAWKSKLEAAEEPPLPPEATFHPTVLPYRGSDRSGRDDEGRISENAADVYQRLLQDADDRIERQRAAAAEAEAQQIARIRSTPGISFLPPDERLQRSRSASARPSGGRSQEVRSADWESLTQQEQEYFQRRHPRAYERMVLIHRSFGTIHAALHAEAAHRQAERELAAAQFPYTSFAQNTTAPYTQPAEERRAELAGMYDRAIALVVSQLLRDANLEVPPGLVAVTEPMPRKCTLDETDDAASLPASPALDAHGTCEEGEVHTVPPLPQNVVRSVTSELRKLVSLELGRRRRRDAGAVLKTLAAACTTALGVAVDDEGGPALTSSISTHPASPSLAARRLPATAYASADALAVLHLAAFDDTLFGGASNLIRSRLCELIDPLPLPPGVMERAATLAPLAVGDVEELHGEDEPHRQTRGRKAARRISAAAFREKADSWVARAKRTKDRNAALAAEKEEQSMAECTFQPTIRPVPDYLKKLRLTRRRFSEVSHEAQLGEALAEQLTPRSEAGDDEDEMLEDGQAGFSVSGGSIRSGVSSASRHSLLDPWEESMVARARGSARRPQQRKRLHHSAPVHSPTNLSRSLNVCDRQVVTSPAAAASSSGLKPHAKAGGGHEPEHALTSASVAAALRAHMSAMGAAAQLSISAPVSKVSSSQSGVADAHELPASRTMRRGGGIPLGLSSSDSRSPSMLHASAADQSTAVASRRTSLGSRATRDEKLTPATAPDPIRGAAAARSARDSIGGSTVGSRSEWMSSLLATLPATLQHFLYKLPPAERLAFLEQCEHPEFAEQAALQIGGVSNGERASSSTRGSDIVSISDDDEAEQEGHGEQCEAEDDDDGGSYGSYGSDGGGIASAGTVGSAEGRRSRRAPKPKGYDAALRRFERAREARVDARAREIAINPRGVSLNDPMTHSNPTSAPSGTALGSPTRSRVALTSAGKSLTPTTAPHLASASFIKRSSTAVEQAAVVARLHRGLASDGSRHTSSTMTWNELVERMRLRLPGSSSSYSMAYPVEAEQEGAPTMHSAVVQSPERSGTLPPVPVLSLPPNTRQAVGSVAPTTPSATDMDSLLYSSQALYGMLQLSSDAAAPSVPKSQRSPCAPAYASASGSTTTIADMLRAAGAPPSMLQSTSSSAPSAAQQLTFGARVSQSSISSVSSQTATLYPLASSLVMPAVPSQTPSQSLSAHPALAASASPPQPSVAPLESQDSLLDSAMSRYMTARASWTPSTSASVPSALTLESDTSIPGASAMGGAPPPPPLKQNVPEAPARAAPPPDIDAASTSTTLPQASTPPPASATRSGTAIFRLMSQMRAAASPAPSRAAVAASSPLPTAAAAQDTGANTAASDAALQPTSAQPSSAAPAPHSSWSTQTPTKTDVSVQSTLAPGIVNNASGAGLASSSGARRTFAPLPRRSPFTPPMLPANLAAMCLDVEHVSHAPNEEELAAAALHASAAARHLCAEGAAVGAPAASASQAAEAAREYTTIEFMLSPSTVMPLRVAVGSSPMRVAQAFVREYGLPTDAAMEQVLAATIERQMQAAGVSC